MLIDAQTKVEVNIQLTFANIAQLVHWNVSSPTIASVWVQDEFKNPVGSLELQFKICFVSI